MSTWIRVTLLVLAAPAATALGQDGPKPAAPDVSVRLSFSVEEYDPSTPSQAVMRCVARNDTDEAVEVPVGYDGERVRVQSGLLTLYRGTKAQGDVKLVRVGPGQEQIVFELPLAQVLGGARGPADPWSWDWPRRPEPPRSPIHEYRQPGFVDRASFSAGLTLGTRTVTSGPAVLKVKP